MFTLIPAKLVPVKTGIGNPNPFASIAQSTDTEYQIPAPRLRRDEPEMTVIRRHALGFLDFQDYCSVWYSSSAATMDFCRPLTLGSLANSRR